MNEQTKKETAQTADPKKTGQPGPAKKMKLSTKFRHGGASVLMTVIFIAIVVVINLIAGALSNRFPSLDVDMTAQKINTLSEDALTAAKSVTTDTDILLLAKEEEVDSIVNAGDMKYSQVVALAKKMQEANSKIHVSFMDLDTNPQFVQQYTDYHPARGDVLVRSDKRVKKLGLTTDLFSQTQNSSTGQYEYSSKVDGALANALTIVSMDKVPTVSVATGHEELLNSAARTAFDQNLKDHGFDVVEFNVLTDAIPDGTDVVMIPTPFTDYTEAEITKLRDFLSDETATNSRTVFYTADYRQDSLPVLNSFLEEWGAQPQTGIVAETDTNNVMPGSDATAIFVDSVNEQFKNSYSYLCSPVSTPINLLFQANDSISASALWQSKDSAYVLVDENSDATKKSAQNVATLSTKMIKKNDEYVNERVVVFGSSFAFTDSMVSSSTFGNKQFFTDLFSSLTGADTSKVYVAPVKVNNYDISASASLVNGLGLGVFTVLIPLVILGFGLFIFLRRRHL